MTKKIELGMGVSVEIKQLKKEKVVIFDNKIENGIWNNKRQVFFQ